MLQYDSTKSGCEVALNGERSKAVASLQGERQLAYFLRKYASLWWTSTLPSRRLNLSWTWVNFHFKNGPAINDQLLSESFWRSRPNQIRKWGKRNHPPIYLPLGYTITESNSSTNTPTTNKDVEGQSQIKRGNPENMNAGPFSSYKAFVTCCIPKLRLGYNSRVGGKITEEANARSNYLDTWTVPGTRLNRKGTPVLTKTGGLLNSVCLNEVVIHINGSGPTIQDLFGAR